MRISKYVKNQNEFIRERIHDFEPLSDRVQDDILTVSAQLEQVDHQKQTNTHQTNDLADIQTNNRGTKLLVNRQQLILIDLQLNIPDATAPAAGAGRFPVQWGGNDLDPRHGAL